jgi:3'-phosphoadenosine 5'-phosphosulfate sulfotransferase (PAPS reductase)/FAD synthetase
MALNENTFTKKDLLRMTGEPVERQYQRILAKIIEAYHLSQGDIVICFSGGKDSALILDMWCEWLTVVGKTDAPVKVAWANTTNETLAMIDYVKWFIERTEQKYGVKIDLHEVRPANGQNIITVMRSEGLPFVSKSVSAIVRKVTKDMEAKGISYDDIKHLHHPTIKCRDTLRDMGLSNTTVLSLTGWSCRRGDFGTDFVLPQQWMPLLDIKRITGHNIRFSEKCCNILKKEPISRLNFPNVMTGEQAVESKTREASWLKNGCNYELPDGSIKSKPLNAVSLDAVLFALKYRDIPICTDYGNIEEYTILTAPNCPKTGYRCTNAQRTGCALCGFGIKFDPERFIRLQETEPAKVRCAFKPISDGGLGYKETCEYLNEYCRTNIIIPEV